MDDATYKAFDLVTKTAAVIVGAAWTYSNYLRSRTHQLRCEVQVKGSCEQTRGAHLVYLSASLKNVGLAKFELVREGCALMVYRLEANAGGPLAGERAGAMDVFAAQGWIEPGEQIYDEAVLTVNLREKDTALSVEMFVRGIARGRMLQRCKEHLLLTWPGRAVLALLLLLSAADAVFWWSSHEGWRATGLLLPMLYAMVVFAVWKTGVERHSDWSSKCVIKIPETETPSRKLGWTGGS